MNKIIPHREYKTYFVLGIKFGIVGSLIGFVLHILWGNLDELKYTVLTGFNIGFFIGVFEPVFLKFEKLPYSAVLLFRTILYFLISFSSVYFFLIIYLKINGYETSALADPKKFENISNIYFLTNVNILFILVYALLTSFIWQLKSFFSRGVLYNYLTGKYHKPSIEDRVFMFLDLNDATSYAEKLGSEKYSSFLSDFFNDIDVAFTKTKGQVFQYVGDEVVIVWKPKDGFKKNNCIKSYIFAVDILETKKKYYLDKYRIFPSFKAGLHWGEVTITEIGVSKKDIAYHGDTINTASRICASAHTLDKHVLISKALYERLDKYSEIVFEDLGQHLLKGKDDKIHLLGI